MNTPIHNARKYLNICHYCNKEFMGKRKNMKVCYEAICKRAYDTEKSRKDYEKRKAQRDAEND